MHRALGPDELNARVLKERSTQISPILALIYNESLAKGNVPDDLRQANVSPVFNKGEKYDAVNYMYTGVRSDFKLNKGPAPPPPREFRRYVLS